MHESRDPRIKFFIDQSDEREGKITVKGWCASMKVQVDDVYLTTAGRRVGTSRYHLARGDVFEFYGRNNMGFFNSGFELTVNVVELNGNCEVCARTKEGESVVLGKIDVRKPTSSSASLGSHDFPIRKSAKPDFVVTDNFYTDPDAVRNFALGVEFAEGVNYFKGKRSIKPYIPAGIKEVFEDMLRRKITKWDYPANGVFQFCTAEEPLVYHLDTQDYAAIVYLTPDAPPDTGTSFYRSKSTGIRSNPTPEDEKRTGKTAQRLLELTFENGFYDKTRFDCVDVVGNVYNRLILFNARYIHAASGYFGTQIENSRLFQIFFFDLEK